jgi:hypothetical protein
LSCISNCNSQYIYLADELNKVDNKNKFIDNFDKKENINKLFECLANSDKEFKKKFLHKDFFKKIFPKKYKKDSIDFGRKIAYKFLVRRFFAMGYIGFEKKVSIFDNYIEILEHENNYKKIQDCVIKFKK